MEEFIRLIEIIQKVKREKHSKYIDLELIVEKFGDVRENGRDLIEELIRVGVLKKDFDKKRMRTLISTTVVSIDDVQDDLTKDRHVSEKRKTIVIDESKWLDDVLDPSERRELPY